MNRRTRKELLLAALLLLSGCATAGPTPQQQDTLGKAIEQVGSNTAQQATRMGSRRVQGEVWRASGGSFGGQVGSVLLGNVGRVIQDAMSRP